MSEWISVEDRLPKGYDDVLIWARNYHGFWKIVIDYYLPDAQAFNRFREANVTHWMPLPEPPEGG